MPRKKSAKRKSIRKTPQIPKSRHVNSVVRRRHNRMPRRILRVKRVKKIGRVRKAGPLNVTRAEFDAVIKSLNERAEIVNELGMSFTQRALRSSPAHDARAVL